MSTQICPQVKAAVSRGACNRCNQDLVRRTQYCCDHISCESTCDWYGNPDHCALARDPDDAAKLNPQAHALQRQMRLSRIKRMSKGDRKRLYKAFTTLNKRLTDWVASKEHSPIGIAELENDFNKEAQRLASGAIIQLVVRGRDTKGNPAVNVHGANDDAAALFEVLQAEVKKRGVGPEEG